MEEQVNVNQPWVINACLEDIDKRIRVCKQQLALSSVPSSKRAIKRVFYSPPPIPLEEPLRDGLLQSRLPLHQSYLLNRIFKKFFEQLEQLEHLIDRLENRNWQLHKAHEDLQVKVERVKHKETQLKQQLRPKPVLHDDDELLLATPCKDPPQYRRLPQPPVEPFTSASFLERSPTEASLLSYKKLADGNRVQELNILAAQLELQLQHDYNQWEQRLKNQSEALNNERQELEKVKSAVSFESLQSQQTVLAEKELVLLKQAKAVAAKEQYLVQKAAEIEQLLQTAIQGEAG